MVHRKLLVLFVLSISLASYSAFAQSVTSGSVTGVVTDPSGAAITDATVSLINVGTNNTQNSKTGGSGDYRFAFVSPGTYTVRINAPGFQPQERKDVIVTAGQPQGVDIQLQLASSSQTITVTEQASVVQSENADVATNYNEQQIALIPNPGSDLTYIAQTAPGVTMNTQGGYGNFSANGMPATSNLFSINGMNFNDPYLNLNNSGASNLMLGSNDVAEANVVNNAYSGQYGQYAGTQVTYVTKSGSNSWHGDAVYLWNGRYLNANDFESNAASSPRSFVNFNQWQTSVQGPIWKDHTFFDVDYEGARVVLPTNPVTVFIPTPSFEAATLAHLTSTGYSAEVPFYQQMFKVFNNAPGAASAIPSSGGSCPSGYAGTDCVNQFTGAAGNHERETQWSARVDHVFGDHDRGYIRVWRDNGFQPTYTDLFSSVFNSYSAQPQMAGQISESHSFGANTVNQFNGSTLFYSAAFANSNPSGAISALPFPVQFSGSFIGAPQPFNANNIVGGASYLFPQGRRVWQYQILDDLSHVAGKHTVRVGFSWLHDNVTELGFGQELNGFLDINSMDDFYNGYGPSSYFTQSFPSATEQPLRFNTFGGYIADDWKVSEALTVSLNLRLENYANPTCDHNCFARFATTFTGAPENVNQPYNQAILFNQHSAYPNTQMIVWEPRIGIAWKVDSSGKTVIRTGAGVFGDELPGVLAQSAAFNAPNIFSPVITSASGGFAPGVPGSLPSIALSSNAAFQSGFASGATFSQLSASVPGFSAPTIAAAFPSNFKQPTYYKWNFEVQRDLGWHLVLDANYSGMHGIHIPIDDNGLNGYGFGTLPATAPDPRFSIVNQYIAGGVSSYNGLAVSIQRRLSDILTFNLNYTWSHALDEVSNGGINPFNLGTDSSILHPQDPYNLRANYGSADQDVRHYMSGTFVVSDLFRHSGIHWGPAKRVLAGWTLSSNLFFRSGLPFTIVDNAESGALAGQNYGGTIFANEIAPANSTCGNHIYTTGPNGAPCFPSTSFSAYGTETGFGNVGRNGFRGPNFFDMDLSLSKNFSLTEKVKLSIGAEAFNALNHPNWDQPVSDVSNTAQFGYSYRLVGPPTSILGAFVGGADSQRFLELRGRLDF
jgi:hypothetical protein